ncbi:MAG: hypothetical protein V2A71_00895, partial [Candidatus Eisenbacteria bacterium]
MRIIGSSTKVTELWGQEFEVVKEGLSESQVIAFVTELFEENKALTRKTERLDFLQKLAEKTVREADELAASVRQQAEEEATTILRKAKDDAAEIKAHGEEEIARLLDASREKLESRLKQKADEVYHGILQRLEGAVTEVWATAPAPEDAGQDLTQQQAFAPAPYEEERGKPVAAGSAFEGKVDLLVTPPVDLAQFMRFRKELQALPQLKITQITSSQKRGSTISTILEEPTPLLDVLNGMPEVRQATPETTGET